MKLTDDVKQRKQKHFKQYRTAKQKPTNKENLVRFLHRGKPQGLDFVKIVLKIKSLNKPRCSNVGTFNGRTPCHSKKNWSCPCVFVKYRLWYSPFYAKFFFLVCLCWSEPISHGEAKYFASIKRPRSGRYTIMITDSCKKQKPNKWMSDSREKANNWITSVANKLQDRIPM